jgi:nucleoside-triphosphatase THEP1
MDIVRQRTNGMSATGRIGVISGSDSNAAQAAIAASVAVWRAAGAKVAGVLPEEHGLQGRSCGAGYLRDIASGERFAIYRDVPAEGSACHIDAEGVEAACSAILGYIAASDLVVLNKFGKLEATRQGLWRALEAAVAAGKPLLLALSAKHVEAFRALAPDAVYLEPDQAMLDRWWRAARGQGAARGV